MLRYGEFEAFVTAGVARSVLLSPDGTMAGALLGDGRVVVTALSGSLADDLLRACTVHGVEVRGGRAAARWRGGSPVAPAPHASRTRPPPPRQPAAACRATAAAR